MRIRLTSAREHNILDFEAETVYLKPGVEIRWFGEGVGFAEITVCMDEVLSNYEMEVDGEALWIGRKDGKVE